MKKSEKHPAITQEDVAGTNIERRTFLGRFGVAAGVAGLVGLTAACGGGASDADSSDADGAATGGEGAATTEPDSAGAAASDSDSSDSDNSDSDSN